MDEVHARNVTYDDLVDRVLMLEQEQASICSIQKEQMNTLTRLADLNLFIGSYTDLLSQLSGGQESVLAKCESLDYKLNSLLKFVTEAPNV